MSPRNQPQQDDEKSRSTNDGESSLDIQTGICDGRTLRDLLSSNELVKGRLCRLQIFKQVVSAVSSSHSKNLIHRDLKPDNIIISSDGKKAKVIGFDVATVALQQQEIVASKQMGNITDKLSTDSIETSPYTSPEQAKGGEYGRKANIFSLGVILFELLCHFEIDDRELLEGILSLSSGAIPEKYKKQFSEEAVDLLESMLNHEQNLRPESIQVEEVDKLIQSVLRVDMHIWEACERGWLQEVQAWAEVEGAGQLVQRKDWDGESLVHMAAGRGQVAVLSYLLEQGASADAGGWFLRRPLQRAAVFDHWEAVCLLLEHGADAGSKDCYGETAVHWAAEAGQSRVLATLLEKGGPIDCCSRLGQTPLHFAAMFGHLPVVKMLFERGASVLIRDADGKTPRQLSLEAEHQEVADLLQEYEVKTEKARHQQIS